MITSLFGTRGGALPAWHWSCHMGVVIWLSYGCHMVVIWLSYGNRHEKYSRHAKASGKCVNKRVGRAPCCMGDVLVADMLASETQEGGGWRHPVRHAARYQIRQGSGEAAPRSQDGPKSYQN